MGNREVFFIADDFGMKPEVNEAILEAHSRGALHGASLMAGQPATAEAIRRAQQTPSLQVGWHLHLDNSQPVTCAAWPWDSSHWRAGWAIGWSRRARQLMRAEVRAQWDLFRDTGLTCAFVNSHHHLHAHPFVYQELLEVLGPSFNGWLRLGRPRFFSADSDAIWMGPADWLWMRRRRRRCPYQCSDTLWGLGRTFRMQADEVIRAIQRLGPGRHEFYFHPRSTAGNDMDLRCLLELKTCEF